MVDQYLKPTQECTTADTIVRHVNATLNDFVPLEQKIEEKHLDLKWHLPHVLPVDQPPMSAAAKAEDFGLFLADSAVKIAMPVAMAGAVITGYVDAKLGCPLSTPNGDKAQPPTAQSPGRK